MSCSGALSRYLSLLGANSTLLSVDIFRHTPAGRGLSNFRGQEGPGLGKLMGSGSVVGRVPVIRDPRPSSDPGGYRVPSRVDRGVMHAGEPLRGMVVREASDDERRRALRRMTSEEVCSLAHSWHAARNHAG